MARTRIKATQMSLGNTLDINEGTGALQIKEVSITNAHISSAAEVAYGKLNLSNSIQNSDINASAAIEYGKLSLSDSIQNSDISATAAVAYSKLNLSESIVNADIAANAAIIDTKLATITSAGKVANSATTASSANTVDAIVTRDASGNFSANTISADLTGSVTGNVSGNVTGNLTGNVTGDLTGDVTGNLTGNVTGDINNVTLGENSDGFSITGGSVEERIFTFAGGEATILAQGAGSSVTLPATGTLATLTGEETLENKTLANPTIGSILNSGSTFNLPVLSNGTHTIATQTYVDAVAQSLDVKKSVKVATTGNLSTTYNNGTDGVDATLTSTISEALVIDGVTLDVGDRVLVKRQTDKIQNGIYEVTIAGDGTTAWVLTRAEDANNAPNAEVTSGVFTFIEEGTTHSNSGFVLASPNSETYTINGVSAIELGVDEIDFSQFSGAGQIVAGPGLDKVGNTLNVVTGNGLNISGNEVILDATVAGAGMTYNAGVLDVGTADINNIIVNANNIDLGENISTTTATVSTSVTTPEINTSGDLTLDATGDVVLTGLEPRIAADNIIRLKSDAGYTILEHNGSHSAVAVQGPVADGSASLAIVNNALNTNLISLDYAVTSGSAVGILEFGQVDNFVLSGNGDKRFARFYNTTGAVEIQSEDTGALDLSSAGELTVRALNGDLEFQDQHTTQAIYLADAQNLAFASGATSIVGAINAAYASSGEELILQFQVANNPLERGNYIDVDGNGGSPYTPVTNDSNATLNLIGDNHLVTDGTITSRFTTTSYEQFRKAVKVYVNGIFLVADDTVFNTDAAPNDVTGRDYSRGVTTDRLYFNFDLNPGDIVTIVAPSAEG